MAASRLQSLVDRWRRGRLLKDVGISTASQAVSSLATLARSALLARYLGLGDFGRLALVLSATSLVSRLASVRAWEWVTVELTKAHQSGDLARAAGVRRAGYLLSFVINAAAAIAVVVLSGWLARSVVNEPSIADALKLNAVGLLIMAPDETSLASLRVRGQYRWLAVNGIVASAIRLVLTIPVLVFDLGLGGVIALILVAQAICSGIVFMKAQCEARAAEGTAVRADLRGVLAEWRTHLRTLFVFSITDTVKTLSVDADALLIGYFHSSEAVGAYRAAFNIVLGVHQLSTPSYMVLYPEVARAIAARDRVRTRRLILHGGALGTLAGALCAAVLTVAAPLVIGAIYGAAFARSIPDLRVMAWSLLVVGAGWANPLFVSIGRSSLTLLMVLVGLAAKVAFMIVFVPALADFGGAIAYTGSYLATVVAAILFAYASARSYFAQSAPTMGAAP